MYPIGTNLPAVLALMFKNKEAAQMIFQGLRKQLGEVDSGRKLRVSIVTGVDKHHPTHYCVVIGAKIPDVKATTPVQMITVSRINRMTPHDSRNLANFLDQFKRAGRYFVAAAYFPPGADAPRVLHGLAIEKEDLLVRPAWQVGEHDPD